jgi:hypothetical protein
VLQALKEAGIYEVSNLLPTRAGFHELDLKAFSRKFFALAPACSSQCIRGSTSITLNAVLCGRHDSTATKLKVLRAILEKKIAVFGNSNGNIG